MRRRAPSSTVDARFMRECLRLAAKGRGNVSPNPMVGAVLVKNGRIVARGYHRRFGGPHAEAECLRSFKGDPRGATMYVNLEPCSHFGMTPPCADLLIRAGIGRVVAAMKDPNPRVAGRGFARLRKNGVRVSVGVLEDEARELNRMYIRSVVTGRPHVHMKVAQSQDGMIAAKGSSRRWISSPASRTLVHRWRAETDAVLVGAGTIRADDPQLTVRHAPGRNPDVIILDGRFAISPGARVLRHRRGRRVFVCVDRAALRLRERKAIQFEKLGVTVLGFRGKGTRLSVDEVLKELYRHNVGSVLVEGGAEVFREFLLSGRIDELSIFTAPTTIGAGLRWLDAAQLPPFDSDHVRFRMVGRDMLMQVRYSFH